MQMLAYVVRHVRDADESRRMCKARTSGDQLKKSRWLVLQTLRESEAPSRICWREFFGVKLLCTTMLDINFLCAAVLCTKKWWNKRFWA